MGISRGVFVMSEKEKKVSLDIGDATYINAVWTTPCARCHASMNYVGYEQDDKHNQHCKDCARILFGELNEKET